MGAQYKFGLNDKFNFFFRPSFGFAPLSANRYDDDNIKTSAECVSAGGIMYGLSTGINVYFGEVAGIYVDLGYNSSKLSIDGAFTDINNGAPTDIKTDVSLSSVSLNFGVALKFGK